MDARPTGLGRLRFGCLHYYRRFRGREEPSKGKGADWEGNLITLQIYDAKSRSTKFVPVLFASQEEQFIPGPLLGHTHYLLNSEDSYARLHAFLTGQAGATPGELRPLITLARNPVQPFRFAPAPLSTDLVFIPLPNESFCAIDCDRLLTQIRTHWRVTNQSAGADAAIYCSAT